VLLSVTFAINAFGVFANLTKLGKLQHNLKELNNGWDSTCYYFVGCNGFRICFCKKWMENCRLFL